MWTTKYWQTQFNNADWDEIGCILSVQKKIQLSIQFLITYNFLYLNVRELFKTDEDEIGYLLPIFRINRYVEIDYDRMKKTFKWIPNLLSPSRSNDFLHQSHSTLKIVICSIFHSYLCFCMLLGSILPTVQVNLSDPNIFHKIWATFEISNLATRV